MRMTDLISKFQLLCPDLTEAMEKNTHHFDRKSLNPFHIEGGTWTHTMQVCLMAEMLKVNDLVKIACLLHDVGKPISTRVDDESKKVKMFNHESLSVFLGLKFLNTLGLSSEEKVRVLQLICYHTFIYKAMRKPETLDKEVMDKFKGNPELVMDLIDMSSCDALGRFMEGNEQRDFWMNAQNNLGHLVFKCDVPLIKRETSGEAIVLVGTPCAGKSTWASKNQKGFTILSRDEIIMELGKGKNYNDAYHSVDQDQVNSEFDKRRKEVIKNDKQIIFDLTNMSVKARRKCLAGLPKEMKRTALVFLAPIEVINERNKKRADTEGKFISDKTLEQMMGSFHFPLITEGFDEIKVIITENDDN